MAKAAKTVEQSWPASTVAMWPLERIIPYARNPKVHPQEQIDLIARAMIDDGVTAPIMVDEDGTIIYGHGRRLAAEKNGFKQYPVVVARGWTDQQKRSARIRDNSYAALAPWSPELLRVELNDLSLAGYDMPLLGFNDIQLVSFLTDMSDPSPPPEEQIPTPPKKPTTKPGDIWTLGRHRIMCGDCRTDSHVKRLLNGAKINVAFTSPPYAEQREYDESSGFKPIPPDDYVEWFAPVAAMVAKHLAGDGSWFVNVKPNADGLDTSLYVFDLVIAHVRKWGWHFATEFCWERGGVPKSVIRRFKNQFEPIYQFSRGEWKMRPRAVMHPSGDVPKNKNGAFRAFGAPSSEQQQEKKGSSTANRKKRGFPTSEGSQGTEWQKNAPLGIPQDEIGDGLAYPGNRLPTFTSEALGHAAAFPVGLPEFFVKAYSDAGDVIYDPFMGSGSTMMAAERTGRIACGTEISPGYVDVIVQRWQNATGGKATRNR